MTNIAEKVGDAYAITKQEGYSSAEAYKIAAKEAMKLGAKARCSSTANTQYPTIVFDMPDGSQAKIMYGGVLHSKEEHWHTAE